MLLAEVTGLEKQLKFGTNGLTAKILVNTTCFKEVKLIFYKLAGKSWHNFATLVLGESQYELDAAPLAQSQIIFLLCVIWAASVRRLKSLAQPCLFC